MVAEGRDVDAHLPGGLENGRSGFRRRRPAVDDQFHFFSASRAETRATALTRGGQTS